MSSPNIPASLKGNIALLTVTTYDAWLELVGKKTRNMIRKAQKSGVAIKVSEPNPKDLWAIYNETPIRQGRAFNHYGVSLDAVKAQVVNSQGVFVCAYFEGSLVGFCELLRSGNTITISQILSLTSHWNKAVNNALIAKTVEYAVSVGVKFIVYARFGNHPSLDQFKRSNGFLPYHIGGHSRLVDYMPSCLVGLLVPVYCWFSRLKAKFVYSSLGATS